MIYIWINFDISKIEFLKLKVKKELNEFEKN